MIRLITRGDDAGSNVTANRAIRDACVEGVLRNVSVMIPCEGAGDASERLSSIDEVCLGLHTTFNAEWSAVRWGPVSDPSEVRSLTMSDGTFPMTVPGLADNGATLDHAMVELQAQLDRGRELGFSFTYADQHMGCGRAIEGFDEAFDRWCSAEGLLNYNPYHRRLERDPDRGGDSVEQLIGDLDACESGQWALVGHPAYVTDEMKQIGNEPDSGEDLALERDWQRRWFMDPRIVDYFEENEIEAIRYDEAEVIDK